MDGREVSLVRAAGARELEVRARNLPRRAMRAYRREDVDAFLSEVLPAIRDLIDENDALRAGAPASQPWDRAPSRITAFDVEDRRLRGARFGGYDMRAVDEYLDQVADLLMRLQHEHEALRSRSGANGGGS
ncbi:MAG TPA: DivIVA domain-containing protein [Actinomycetota bacterium]|nr:DivIVA domain-containing protein [Actinomycetota bacterium]